MSTVTFQWEEQKVQQLAEAARERGLEVEELLREIASDFLARTATQAEFKKALAASTTENAELLRRLAK